MPAKGADIRPDDYILSHITQQQAYHKTSNYFRAANL